MVTPRAAIVICHVLPVLICRRLEWMPQNAWVIVAKSAMITTARAVYGCLYNTNVIMQKLSTKRPVGSKTASRSDAKFKDLRAVTPCASGDDIIP